MHARNNDRSKKMFIPFTKHETASCNNCRRQCIQKKHQWIDRSMFESIFQQRKTDGIRGIGNHRQTTTRLRLRQPAHTCLHPTNVRQVTKISQCSIICKAVSPVAPKKSVALFIPASIGSSHHFCIPPRTTSPARKKATSNPSRSISGLWYR